MIEFKTNYDKVPWEMVERDGFHGLRIFSGSKYIAFVGNTDDTPDQYTSNAALVAAASKMSEYMMDRAKYLDQLITAKYSLGSPRIKIGITSKQQELEEILSILKDAGIKVIEK